MLHLAGILFPHISTRISWVCELLSRWRFKSSRTYKHCVIWAGHDFSNDPSVFFFQAILHQELFIILFVMDCVILKMTAAMITSNLGLQVFFMDSSACTRLRFPGCALRQRPEASDITRTPTLLLSLYNAEVCCVQTWSNGCIKNACFTLCMSGWISHNYLLLSFWLSARLSTIIKIHPLVNRYW